MNNAAGKIMFSVVIPVYNGVTHIRQCLDSIRMQTYDNWEAICIDDGSVDGTSYVLHEISVNDPRVKYASQANKGVVEARRAGVEKARADYVLFMDADDSLVPTAMEEIAGTIKKNLSPDIIVFGARYLKNGAVIKTTEADFNELDNIAYLKKVLTRRLGWELWGKAYKRELYDHDISYPHNVRVIGEDLVIFPQLARFAGRIIGLNKPLYNYVIHPGSVTHIKSVKSVEENLLAAFFVEDFLAGSDIYAKIKPETDCMCLLVFTNSTRRGFLPSAHPLVQRLKKQNVTWKALRRMAFAKRWYALFMLYFYLPLFVRGRIKADL